MSIDPDSGVLDMLLTGAEYSNASESREFPGDKASAHGWTSGDQRRSPSGAQWRPSGGRMAVRRDRGRGSHQLPGQRYVFVYPRVVKPSDGRWRDAVT